MHATRPTFFLWMTVLMAAFVFAGFGMTYLIPMAGGTLRPAPPVVHLHGLAFFLWMVLLVLQASLVRARNVALHRSFGTFGISLGTVMMITGALVTLLSATRNRYQQGPNYHHGIYLGIMGVVGFALLFTLALRNVSRPEIHKRLILLAMLPVLPPGVHRVYMVPLGLTTFPVLAMYITLDAMALAILVQEWRATRRIGAYTRIGVAWILVQQALHYPVTHSQWFADFVSAMCDMVRYR
jgi:hypothetical protein